MADHRQGDYRGSHFSSETLKAMEQGKRGQASQARVQERLQRKEEARRRKIERHEGDVTNPPMESIEPQAPNESTFPAIETPQSPIARLWRVLKSFRGPERF